MNVVIPVKKLSGSKQRLSEVLGSDQRQILVLVMLDDIIRELKKSSLIDDIFILTEDDYIIHSVAPYEVKVAKHKPGLDINEALQYYLNNFSEPSEDQLLIVLPSDVPLLKHTTINSVVRKVLSSTPPIMAISPSDNNGTNCLIMYPCNLMSFHYGQGSLQAHIYEAASREISLIIHDSYDLKFDIDTPKDLYELLKRHRSIKTSFYLNRILKNKS